LERLGAQSLARRPGSSIGAGKIVPHLFTSNGYAVTSERLDLGVNPERGAFQIGGIFTLRLRVFTEGTKEIFVGVGPSTDVDRYLARSGHDQVTDVQLDPYQATYRTLPGDLSPGPPAAQAFWAAQEAGTTQQTLIWQPRSGQWTLVIMNADGSRPVNAQMSVGVRVRFLTWIAIGLFIAAFVAFIAGGLMLYFGVRAPKVLVTDVPPDPVLTPSSTE
jgi:hypothetical protein